MHNRCGFAERNLAEEPIDLALSPFAKQGMVWFTILDAHLIAHRQLFAAVLAVVVNLGCNSLRLDAAGWIP
jgi:hypothetical protein